MKSSLRKTTGLQWVGFYLTSTPKKPSRRTTGTAMTSVCYSRFEGL